MNKQYLEKEITNYQLEMKDAIAENDTDYITQLNAWIAEAQAKDTPHKRIKIENEITLATIKKITRYNLASLEDYAEHGQPMENLDNGFVTEDMLNRIIDVILHEKNDGSFRKSVKDLFGNRNKVRFIKSKLQELKEVTQ